MELLIPACYFLTQQLFVNHDESLNQESLLDLQVFKEPELVLDYLKRDYHPIFNSTDLFEIEDHTEYYDLSAPHPIRMNTQVMRQMVTDKRCHGDISVLVVNYHTDEMQDLTWLASIHYPSIKRVLIIHEEALPVAEDAIREGLIHAYVKREDPHFSQRLKQTIQEQEWQYFVDLTSPITTINSDDFNYLANPAIFAFFKDFLKKQKIASFCLIYKFGNFLLLDQEDRKSYLIVRSKARLKQVAAVGEKDNSAKEVIQKLKEGTSLLFFGEEKEFWQVPAADWGQYLHPASSIPANDHFVYFYTQEF